MVRLFTWSSQNFYGYANALVLSMFLFNKPCYVQNYKYPSHTLNYSLPIQTPKYEYYNDDLYPIMRMTPIIIEANNLVIINGRSIFLPFGKRADDIEVNKTNVVIRVNNNGTIWETTVAI